MEQQGIVFNIQRFTIHDGPGMRTELFLKGCPMRCRWCSNPEGQSAVMQPGVYRKKCLGRSKCGLCEEVCPAETLTFSDDCLTTINRSRCSSCMSCAEACPADAIKQWGRRVSVADCMRVIRRDRGYYERSGGGVTLSGGDPLVQADFSAALLRACREEGIHTCLESTMHADWSEIEKVLPWTDLFLSDLKHMDWRQHKKYTGVTNTTLRRNLRRLVQSGARLILRIPVIPGVNDDEENLAASADFILNDLQGRVQSLQLLSFMRLGVEKYESLGMPYRMADVRVNRRSLQKRIEQMAASFRERGIHCTVGTRDDNGAKPQRSVAE
ncbi:MAG: (2S)-3-sulfopropanediol dehydratase activating enzyme [Anaerovoracaceae bacterium]